MSLFRGWGVDAHKTLVYITVGGGLLLFTLGTLAWFVARQRKSSMADFWVYRFSRHPQYLGWIVWSYGMLISLQRIRYPKRSWGIPSSLPWLLSAIVIVGVALLEERKMKRLSGEAYDDYRRKTSFLFPVPRFIRVVFAAPNRLLFKKSFPERKGEIAAVLVLYTALLVVCSHFYIGHRRYAEVDVQVGIAETEAARVAKLIDEMRRTDSGRRRYRIADVLSDIGDAAVDPLIALLSDSNPANRQEAAWALGRIGSSRATEPLLERLADEEDGVRFQAVGALGNIGSREAVPALISLVGGENDSLHRSAADALGRIGAEEAVGPLTEAMDKPNWWDRSAVVDALGQIGSSAAVAPLAARLKDEEVHVRRSIVVALLKIGSGKAAAALEDALDDEDWEVRLYAAEALKKLGVR
jgi:HEAT repeat protein/protein-S-isoprenylcysteine O-methyltransferase Ste14